VREGLVSPELAARLEQGEHLLKELRRRFITALTQAPAPDQEPADLLRRLAAGLDEGD